MANVIEVRDPADQRVVVGEVPALSAGDVTAAYARARSALGAWRQAGPLERAAVMSRAADLIRDRAAEGAVILVKENGKTLAEARVEVGKTADFLDYYASFARQPWGEILSDARPGTQTSLRVEPVGVVLAITPWNDPMITPGRKLGPALIAGNAVLLKAASQTPLIAGWLADRFAGAGLPDGVLRHIERAADEGATVLAGGGRPGDEARRHGCYVEPTLVRVDPGSHALWREEVFGPVLAITTAADFDDAVARANDTTYGLSAAVFTTSLKSANLFIDRSDTGQVSVNLPTAGWDVHHPFGGFRDSGSAFKEQGSPGLRFYTRIKTAAVKFSSS